MLNRIPNISSEPSGGEAGDAVIKDDPFFLNQLQESLPRNQQHEKESEIGSASENGFKRHLDFKNGLINVNIEKIGFFDSA